MNNVAARGAWGSVEWAIDSNGSMPAKDFFYCTGLSDDDRAKILELFKRLAETGRIHNREKFRQLGKDAGQQGRGLWEFKDFQTRFIGDFRQGGRFVVAHGLIKKKDNLPASAVTIALRVLTEHDQRTRGEERK